MGSVGSGWDGLPAWLCTHRANGIKGVFTGRRKEELGASMGLRNLVSCVGSGKHWLLSLARRKLGASGGLGALPC